MTIKGGLPIRRDAAPAPDAAAPTDYGRKSAIVTVRRRKHTHSADVSDMTREEHKQRGDAADALFRKMKRWLAQKPQP